MLTQWKKRKQCHFYGWKYKHYFVIVEVGENNIRAHCKLCAGNKTAQNTTFNFKKHLDDGTRLAIATQESAIISSLFCTNLDDHLKSNM